MNEHSIKLMPKEERPYEKARLYGVEALSDAELLAIVLRTGSRRQNVLELSRQLLSEHQNGLANLYQMSATEMQNLPGIGSVKAVQLKCIGEIAKRIHRQSAAERITLSNAGSVAAYYMEELRHFPTERVVVSMYDSGSHLLGDCLLSIGTVNQSLVSPREVFLKALEAKAVYVILLHNHPSGEVIPSKADIHVTEEVKKCGEMIGISLVDHIIIGDNIYYSFREHQLVI